MAEAEAGIRTSLKDRVQTVRGLRDVKDEVGAVGRQAKESGRLAKTGSLGFDAMRKSGKLAAAAIKVGFGVALAAGYGTIRLLRSSFDEARQAQRVGALTRQTLKSMGKEATTTARHVENLSGRLSRQVGIDDELVQGGDNVLLRFKDIRNELGKGNKIFDRATKASTNMAAALAGDNSTANIAGAAQKVGRLLEDPIKGMGLLARSGVVFTDQQKDQVKAMVDGNNLLGAQRFLLDQLQKRYGGAAAAQATWGDKADVVFKNIEERIGTALLPLLDDVERWFVKKGAPELNHYVGIFEKKGVPALKDFADQARPVATRLLPKISDVIGTVAGDLKTAARYGEDLLNVFTGMPDWAKKAIVGGALTGYAGNKLGVFKAINALAASGGGLAGVSKTRPLPVLVTNPGFGGTSTTTTGGVAPSGDDRRPKSRAARAGNNIAANVAILLGPEIADQVSKDIVFPWQEGPFSRKPQGNAVDRFVQKLAGITPDTPHAPDFFGHVFDQVAQTAEQARLKALLLGQTVVEVHKSSMKTYLSDLAAAGKPVTTKITADTSSAIANIDALERRIHSVATDAFNAFASLGGGSTPSTPTTPRVHRPKHPKTPTSDTGQRTTPGGGLRIEIPVMVDRREIARAVYDQTKADLADR